MKVKKAALWPPSLLKDVFLFFPIVLAAMRQIIVAGFIPFKLFRIVSYLGDILQANDSALLAAALGDIARARGMADIARGAGLTR